MPRTNQRSRIQDFIVTPGDAIRSEDATVVGDSGGSVPITAGDQPVAGATGGGGDVILTSGSVTDAGSSGDAGDITLTPGVAAGSGANGDIILSYATWPATDGGAGEVLTTNGAGVLSWAAAGGGVTNLQTAYEGGNTIVTDTTNGDFDVSGTEAVSLDASMASNFTVDGAALTLSTTTTGSVLVDGVDGVEVNSSAGALQIGNDAATGAINVGTGAAARTITIGNTTGATTVNVDAGSGDINLNTDTTINGKLTVTGLIDPTGLVLDEQGVRPFDPTGTDQGLIWVSAGAPNTLIFTDDAGTDHTLGAGAAWSVVLSTGNTTGGTDAVISSGDEITGVDSAGGPGTGFTMRGGDHTGAVAGAGNVGGDLIIIGGSTNGPTNGVTGGDVTIQGGAILGGAGGTARGGIVTILGGDASGGSGASDGGNVVITGGTGRDIAGDVIITGGTTSSGTGGDVTVDAGTPTAGGGNGGSVFIRSALGNGNGDSGDIVIAVPDPGAGLVAGGSVSIDAGNTLTQNSPGGDVDIGAGDSSGSGAVRGGDVTLTGGDQTSGTGGRGGTIILTTGDSTNASFAAGTVTMTGPNDEDEPIAVLTTTGTNGDSVQLFVGDSDPSGSVTGLAGSLFFRDTGATGELYLNTSAVSGTTWSAVNTGGASTLQQAYEAGNTIVTDATNGAFDVSGTQVISLDSTAASNFTVTGAGLTLSTATSGTLAVTSAGVLDLDSGTASAVTVNAGAGSGSAGGAVSVTSGAGNGAFDGGAVTITSGDSGAGATGNGGTITITAGDAASTNGDGGDIVLNPGALSGAGNDGEVTINGKLNVTGGIDPTYLGLNDQATQPFTAASGLGFLWVDNTVSPHRFVLTDENDDDILISASTGITFPAACSINGTGASTITTDGGTLTLQTTSSGDVALSSAADITLTPASGQTTSISGPRTSVNRVQHDQGTALVAGDFALSAGWGTTATVTSIAGTDSRFILEWISTGTSQAPSPTITLTFADGAWPNAPFPIFVDNGSIDGGGGYFAPQFELTSVTTTTAVWTLRSAAANGSSTSYVPGAADTWKAICHIMG